MPDDELLRRTSTEDAAFVLEMLEHKTYAVTKYINRESMKHLQSITEEFYWAYTIAMSPKNWPMMPMLSQMILELSASGIQQYYEGIVT